MKLKQLLEQLKLVLRGALLISPAISGGLLTWYGLEWIVSKNLVEEFFGTLFTIFIIALCYLIGKLAKDAR